MTPTKIETLAQLHTLDLEGLRAAYSEGHLDQILGKAKITPEDLKSMTPEQIFKARKRGQLDHLLKGE